MNTNFNTLLNQGAYSLFPLFDQLGAGDLVLLGQINKRTATVVQRYLGVQIEEVGGLKEELSLIKKAKQKVGSDQGETQTTKIIAVAAKLAEELPQFPLVKCLAPTARRNYLRGIFQELRESGELKSSLSKKLQATASLVQSVATSRGCSKKLSIKNSSPRELMTKGFPSVIKATQEMNSFARDFVVSEAIYDSNQPNLVQLLIITGKVNDGRKKTLAGIAEQRGLLEVLEVLSPASQALSIPETNVRCLTEVIDSKKPKVAEKQDSSKRCAIS